MKLLELVAAHWDTIAAVAAVIVAVVRAMKSEAGKVAAEGETSQYKKATAIAVAGFEALAVHLPAAKAKATKSEVKSFATEQGVAGVLHEVVVAVTKDKHAVVDATGRIRTEVVRKATEPERKAHRPDGLPDLGAVMLVLMLLVSGCSVPAEARRAAEVLHKRLDTLESASVPHPAYGDDPRAMAAYKRYWSEAHAASADLVTALGGSLLAEMDEAEASK